MESLKERIETALANLDAMLQARNVRERVLIFLMPLFLFGFIAYEYLIPAQQKQNAAISARLKTMTSEMNTYRDLLSAKSGGSKNYLDNLRKENSKLQNKIAETKDLSLYAHSKLENLGFIRFSPSSWSEFLHQLVTQATKNSIDMSTFSNTRYTEGSGFRKVLSVDFNATGSFYNMVNFIRDIENDRAVTDIEKLSLQSGPMIKADFTISLWGLVQ